MNKNVNDSIPIQCFCAIFCLFVLTLARGADDIVLADFEGDTYGEWKTTGDAFGSGPAHGTLPHQQKVDGYVGNGLADSYHGGDSATGTLSSPKFKIERKYINFLIGGGGFPGKTCLNLRVDGKIVRTATGPHTMPGGKETLAPQSWDVTQFAGKHATLEVVDQQTGGWGHINVDQIVASDVRAPGVLWNQTRTIVIDRAYLRLPIKNEGPLRHLTFFIAGKPESAIDLSLADGPADWWAFKDVAAWRGQDVTMQVDTMPQVSMALTGIDQADRITNPGNLYHEQLRPQFHFSAQRGWLNDPNGLVYFHGEYHLFFQHNPYGWSQGPKYWGHAISRDLVHWEELGEALYPDDKGQMYSGSAVVDWNNTSGFGTDGQPAMVLIYTAAGHPTTQCLAYSRDGRTFTKYAANPVVPQIFRGNRDPKVIWYEPAKRWIMVLYAGFPTGDKDAKGSAKTLDTIQFLSSADLKSWKVTGQIPFSPECPDFFELPLDGNLGNKKWVLSSAISDYIVGRFDGTMFTPETPMIHGLSTSVFYAPQTFSDIPAQDGRRIRIGWLRAPSPGMPFNQAMSVPMELNLVSTPEGPRLTWKPVAELNSLRGTAQHLKSLTLQPGDANLVVTAKGQSLEIDLKLHPDQAKRIELEVGGALITYDGQRQQIGVNGNKAKAPLRDGAVALRIFLDRTTLEIFGDNGLVYIPQDVTPRTGDAMLSFRAEGGPANIDTLDIYQLRSAWK